MVMQCVWDCGRIYQLIHGDAVCGDVGGLIG